MHAARLPARVDGAGDLIALLCDQDRTLWDGGLVAEGLRLLHESATGSAITEYHVEAAIAAVHASAPSAGATRWGEIVSPYDTLLSLRASPVVALQRALAVAELAGPVGGLDAIAAIEGRERLAAYPFYFAAMGELELRKGNRDVARAHLEAALAVARSGMERRFLLLRVAACEGASGA